MNFSSEFVRQLLQIKAIKLNPQNPFTWASGIKSPVYCDNRIVLSFPEARKTAIKGLAALSKEFPAFDVVAGVATAGIPHGALLANELEKPFVYVRNKAKVHGRKNLIEGYLEANKKVLVVEDLISTGGSCLKAVEAIKHNDCEVVGVIALFSYGFERAKQAFKAANCSFKTISNYDKLIQEAVEAKYISAGDLESLRQWRKDPENWLVTDNQ